MIPKFNPDTSVPTLTQEPLVVNSMEDLQRVFQKELTPNDVATETDLNDVDDNMTDYNICGAITPELPQSNIRVGMSQQELDALRAHNIVSDITWTSKYTPLKY